MNRGYRGGVPLIRYEIYMGNVDRRGNGFRTSDLGFREGAAAEAAGNLYGEYEKIEKAGCGVRDAGCGEVSALMRRRILFGACGQAGKKRISDFGFGISDFGKVCR